MFGVSEVVGRRTVDGDCPCVGGRISVGILPGVDGERIYAFDPYLLEEPLPEADIVVTDAHPYRYNRIIPFSYFNRTGHTQYALGETSGREAVLLFNTHTELTEEKTIEYII